MTDDKVVRIALELAALVVTVRTYTETHPTQCDCPLCKALDRLDRRDK